MMREARHIARGLVWHAAVMGLLVCSVWVLSAPALENTVGADGGYDLLTEEQYAQLEQSQTAYTVGEQKMQCSTRPSVPGGPVLTVESPDLTKSVVSPVDLRVRFESAPDAEVQVETLKVCVATFFRPIEVTSTVLKHATVTPQGLVSKGTQLRIGDYDVVIEIADSKQRLTRQHFAVQVKRPKR